MSENLESVPEGLPPLPPVPEGYDRWHNHGAGYHSQGRVGHFMLIHREDTSGQWYPFTTAEGMPNLIAIEAVRAEPEVCPECGGQGGNPADICHKCEGAGSIVRAEPACQTCKGHGFIPAWTPSYRDPDNNAGDPDTVECPDCAEPELSATLSEPQIESSPTPWDANSETKEEWLSRQRGKFQIIERESDALKAELSHLYESFRCFQCGDSHTPLSCLNCAQDALKAENERLRKALGRIKNCEDAPDIDATGEWQFGLHCGVEDRGCLDRYEGADYGHARGVEKALEWAVNEATEALAKEGDRE